MIMTDGETNAPVRSYSVPWYLPRLAIASGLALVALLIVTGSLFLYYFSESREVEGLRAELKASNAAVAKLDTLQEEMAHHREFTRRIAGLLGISVPNFADSVLANRADRDELADADLELPDYTIGGDDMQYTGSGVLVTACPPDPNNRPRGMPLSGSVSRGYAPRQPNPSLRHHGIDFAAREGTPVLATADGVVEFAGEHEAFGFLITIDHGNGFKTSYGHNSLLLVRSGEKIRRGDRIAYSGNTGLSTAPHLHYEVIENGVAIDPTGFLGN